ncbi:MAG: hypothetical protein ACTSU5_20940, partial [Promethearchaeota archaeon]
MVETRVPEVREKSWSFCKGETDASELIGAIESDPAAGRFQWDMVEGGASGGPGESVLERFLEAFRKHWAAGGNDRRAFEELFAKLEAEVLLSDSWNYTLLCPAYEVYFPGGSDLVELDDNHVLRRLCEEDRDLPRLDDLDRRWPIYSLDNPYCKRPNAIVEIRVAVKKLWKNCGHYKFHPAHPGQLFDREVLCVHDFHVVFTEAPYEYTSAELNLKPAYYLVTPPFSTEPGSPVQQVGLGAYIPPPRSQLRLDDPRTLRRWEGAWRGHFKWFRAKFYPGSGRSARGFLHALKVLRVVPDLHDLDAARFLLVSGLEGLLHPGDKKKKNFWKDKERTNDKAKYEDYRKGKHGLVRYFFRRLAEREDFRYPATLE